MLKYKGKKKPEARRADSGSGVLGGGIELPPHQLEGLGGTVSSPSGKFEIWCNLRR